MTEPNTEQEFLKQYNANDYERPSVTADIVIFTLTKAKELAVLLIKRKGHPYKDQWAIPGGFLNAGKESLDDAAKRELQEETGVTGTNLRQLYTFSNPDRDPRTHVVSCVYTACVPLSKLQIQAGDDAKEAQLFTIKQTEQGYSFLQGKPIDPYGTMYETLTLDKLAFDHGEILRMAINRLQNRIYYDYDAMDFLSDQKTFTIYELKQVYDAITYKESNNSNFRKFFQKLYGKTGKATSTGETKPGKGHRPAALYQFHPEIRKEPNYDC